MDTPMTESGRPQTKQWLSAAAFAAGLLLLAAVLVALSAPPGEEGRLGRWLTAYRHEHGLLGLGSALVVGGLLTFVPGRRLKVLLLLLGVAALTNHWLLPFGSPWVLRGRLSRLQTTLAAGDVCLQSTGYTCGPACVVTALRRFGVSAEEGAVAVATRANPFSGAQEEHLIDCINELGRSRGISAQLTRFASLEELKEAPVIIPVTHSFLVNHYVVYLGRQGTGLLVGDPLAGRGTWPAEELSKRWFKVGIVLRQSR